MSATPGRRIGAAALAAAWGLVVGATAAAALGTAQVLVRPGLEVAPTPRALIRMPLMILAEGLFWGLLGGAMFVFPLAVVAFAVFRPRNTQPAALSISALLLVPIVLVGFRSRLIDALSLALPMWLGVRVALRTFERMMPTPTDQEPLRSSAAKNSAG
jgi:hypothetical protein